MQEICSPGGMRGPFLIAEHVPGDEIRCFLPRTNPAQEGQAIGAARRAWKDSVVKAEPSACTCFGLVSVLILTALKNQKRTLG